MSHPFNPEEECRSSAPRLMRTLGLEPDPW
jgi:hypothetical protein